MKHTLKRLLALVLTLAMVCGLMPTIAFAEEPATETSAEVITAEDDALVQSDILDGIDSYFSASAKRSQQLTLADYVAATDDIKAMVMASDTYVEGSIVDRGDGFFWQTDTGITCGYFPKDRYEADQRVATKSVNTSALATWNYSSATKKDVCLVAPMYSEDTTFTNQYTNEALAIAAATGGTAYGLIDTDATVTAIGQAIEKCGVVIFDSHGNTDWGYFDGGSDGTGEADCTSQANTSYLCLSSGTGMTTSDCAYVTGTYGTYPHAYKDSSGNYVADGTAFANHMSGNAPSSILWMAICLGMATDGMCAPLRNKGVSVVYGYSQSVSFDGDYAYETSFWDSMIAGDTVATAVSTMKNSLGKWDPAYSSYSFSTAVANYCAFPIVASEEDTYPGQGNVDNYQTVNSTWKLSSLSTPAEPITLTLNDNGTVTTENATSFTLPSCTAPTGYTFAGWSATALSSEVTAKPTLYAAGSTYTNESDVTLYAVYARTEGGSGSGEWKLVSDASTLAAGAQLLIASNAKGFVAGAISSSVMTNIAATFATDYSTVTKPDTAVVLTLGGSEGAWTLANASGQLLGATAAKKLAWGSGTTTWSISISGNDATIQNGTSTYGRFLYNVGSPRFTTYTSATSATMLLPQLYMLDGSAGTTYYTTAPTTCEHANTVNTDAVAATCTSVGYTAGVYCNDCGKYISGHEEIAMTDHTYGDWTSNSNGTHSRTCSVCSNVETADCTYTTSTSGATTTYTCSVCGYSYSETKDTYTVTYSAPSGTTTADVVDGNSVTLPTAEAVDGYTFKGWVTAAIAAETTTAPTVLTGTYTPTASVTLYAVYTRTETTTGSGSSVYTLVTDPAQLQIGSSIIFTMNGTETGAMSATQGTNNRASVTGGVKSDDLSTFTPAEGTGEFVLGYGTTDGTYSFYDNGNSGYLYAASSSKNYLRTQSTLDANGSWKIAISSNEATITAQGSNTRNILRYNSTSKLFSCYSSGQQTVNIYQKGSGTTTTTYYTTSPVVCAHSSTTTTTVDATCTTAGSVTVTCDVCGIILSTDTIPATGHSYSDWASNNNGTHSRTCSVCGDVETENCSYTTSVSGATISYTCSVCGYSYSEVKDTYTVTYSAPSGITTADVLDGETVTLPTADAVEGYTFSGWVTAAIDPETATAPTILTGTYTPTASVTLYALYTRTVSTGSGAASLTKMAAGDTLSAGDNIVVVANGTTVAMYQATINSSYVNLFTFDGNAESIAADSKNYWTVSAGSTTGTYVLGDSENGYLYTSGSNNLAASSSASDWTLVDNGDGTFKLQANGRNLSYRSDLSSNPYWRMGGSNFGTSGNTVLDIYKYVPGSASTTYYTTNPTVTAECAHTNVTAVAAVDATCTTAGSLAYWHCADCGKYFSDAACTTETTLEAVTIAATGHNWVEATEGENYVAPTCTEAGLAYMVCSVCGEVGAGREIPALGHDMVAGTVHPATCTEDGYTEYACSRCDATDIGDIVSATGHTEVTDAAVPATCTETGLTEGSHCSVCNEVIVAQTEVAALGHTYTYVDNGDGTHTATCSVCNNTVTEDHTFPDGSCVCGAVEATGPVPASDLVFFNKSLSLQSYVAANFLVRNSVLKNYDSWYVVFQTVDAEKGAIEVTNTGVTFASSYQQFEYKIYSYQMTDDVTATLYAVKDGVTYIGETYTMSVRSYTMTKMASTTSEAGLTMMANMLYYGAMAQINRGYKTDDLANSELGDTYGGYVTTAVPSVTDTSSTTSNGLTGATKVQFALGNAASVQLQYVMKLASGVSADNIYAKAVYTHKGVETTVEIDGSQLVKQGSFYIAIVDSLWANEGRVPVSLTVYDKTTGEAISETWTFSIENYVASRQSSTNTNLV
ncbi:MAG: InlB B-repeat-containing protein, partial [Candidatus Faecousia sp.]|nr:InlB B-repeat-containing protein [Candidatus Faecousia sp.]